MISDAAKQVDVEPHVLRYWEEELELPIRRNELGHRYYTEQDIKLLKSIKVLKEQGFQLKAIKILLPDLNQLEELDSQTLHKLKEELNDSITEETAEASSSPEETAVSAAASDSVVVVEDKLSQFKTMMNQLIVSALKENNQELSTQVSKQMDYLFRMQEEQEEIRFQKLDQAIRGRQKKRKEIAMTVEMPKKKRRFWKKKQVPQSQS